MTEPPLDDRLDAQAAASGARDPVDWAMGVVGITLALGGLFLIAVRHSNLYGPLIAGLGLTLITGRWPGVVGGVVIAGAGIYQFMFFKSFTTMGAVLLAVGLVVVLDRLRRVGR